VRGINQSLRTAALLERRGHVDGFWKVNGEISIDDVGGKTICWINAIEAEKEERKIREKDGEIWFFFLPDIKMIHKNQMNVGDVCHIITAYNSRHQQQQQQQR
jgi:hypothetical protein